METSIADEFAGSSPCDEWKVIDNVSTIRTDSGSATPEDSTMVVQRHPQQDSSALPEHKEDAAHRAREILGSLKVRREFLLQTVRATCPSSHEPTDGSVTSHSSAARRSLEELTMKSSRLRSCGFDGTESQLLTAHMAKVLQERRDRLTRILAGMDPDDDITPTRPPPTAKDDARDASPTAQETTETDIDDNTVEDPAKDAAASVHDSESSQLSDDDNTIHHVDDLNGGMFTAMPPTLQEIEDAFGITDDAPWGDLTNELSELDDRETSVVAEEDEDRRVVAEGDEDGRCATDLTVNVPSRDEDDGSTTGGFEPIASPVSLRGSPVSPIRRANSFGDSTIGLERGGNRSIRAALSFDSLFLESKRSRMTPSHQLLTESQRFFPVSAAREVETREERGKSTDLASLKEKETMRSLHAALTEPTASSCTVDSLDLTSHAKRESQEDVSNEATPLLNFFPPAKPAPTGGGRKLPKVTTVTDEIEDDSSKSGTAVSSSSTLTTKEERMGYLHNLMALQVKRPVPRYPPDDVSPANRTFDAARVRAKPDYIGEDRVPSPRPGTFMAGLSEGRGHNDLVTASSSLLEGEEERSFTMISDTSSFDGTYDDTVTSGYLSLGASERLNSLMGDDCTELSILMSTNASFDESLEDGASVEMLLRPPQAVPATATKGAGEATTGPNRGISILSPTITSSTPLESCLLSSSGASRDNRSTSVVKRVAFAEVAPSPERPVRPYRKPPLLFVAEDIADSLCGTYGGLYSILLASGFCAETGTGADAAGKGSAGPPLPLTKPLKRSTRMQFLRLNPDFRCGAQGSTYDICIQSGFDVTTPWQWTKRRKYLPVKGGLFDVAKKSGLTKELMRSRTPLVVKTKPLSLCREEDSEVLPEDVSDYECGATGNLYLAFESGGGDYVSKGSLYYLATRSGFKVSQ